LATVSIPAGGTVTIIVCLIVDRNTGSAIVTEVRMGAVWNTDDNGIFNDQLQNGPIENTCIKMIGIHLSLKPNIGCQRKLCT